jgi:glutathione synthase/RimK-type ligase-like ATP-grasp enzyme
MNNEIDYSIYESVDDLKAAFSINEDKRDEPKGSEKPDKVLKADKLPVVYADLNIKKYHNIFKHWIIFTNDRSDENKTLKNIHEAIKDFDMKPELHIFVAADMDAEEDESRITIRDDEEEFTIEKESNLDTLVFARLGVQGEDECEHAVQLLQDRGFLVLNPIRPSQIACDKYQSACLFEKGNIPQPRFCLMTKEDFYDADSFKAQITRVYPDYNFNDPDKNKDKDLVIKILDGHGGTGVMLIDCKRTTAVLQAIFAIDPERRLIIQRKEEGDGGDIRVHVLTLRNKQIILAAMKRQQLGGDFRSNVSLGAEAVPIKLTPEQEQIALRTAMLSKLPWCAVDIMPLVKGSNKEIGDNVVLEINASPGTFGISEVIKRNFINVMVNELNDPSEFMLQDKTAGFVESINIKFADNVHVDMLAKLDTGNSTTASTMEVGKFADNGKEISFKVGGKNLSFKKQKSMIAKAGEEQYERPTIIVPEITVGLRKVKDVRFAVVKSRENKTTNVLLNRDVLSRLGYTVHPSTAHILTPEMQKIDVSRL